MHRQASFDWPVLRSMIAIFPIPSIREDSELAKVKARSKTLGFVKPSRSSRRPFGPKLLEDRTRGTAKRPIPLTFLTARKQWIIKILPSQSTWAHRVAV